MFETIKHLDQQFFVAVNSGMQNALLDWLCPWMRNQYVWYPLYLVLFFFIYKKYKNETLWIATGIILLVLVSDQLSANVIKNLVQRLRPCNDPSMQGHIRLFVNCGSGFSFVSAHATNHFAIAVYFSSFFSSQRKWFLPIALLWAAGIAFSQVYVGVHYPLDVICGALIGSLLGAVASRLVFMKIKTTHE
ncbi:MAG: phosphatase PAP2 family protein [Bacteroidia bacterium]